MNRDLVNLHSNIIVMFIWSSVKKKMSLKTHVTFTFGGLFYNTVHLETGYKLVIDRVKKFWTESDRLFLCSSDQPPSGLENFPQKYQIFHFFASDQKNIIGLGQKYPGQRRVGPLFSVGHKYAQFGSGQGSSLEQNRDGSFKVRSTFESLSCFH